MIKNMYYFSIHKHINKTTFIFYFLFKVNEKFLIKLLDAL